MKKNTQKKDKKALLVQGYFFLTALTAGAAFYQLATIGENSLHSVFLGYSASRLSMMLIPLCWIIIAIIALWDTRKKIPSAIIRISKNPARNTALSILFLMIFLVWIIGGFLSDQSFHPFFERIQPLLILGMVITGLGVLLLSAIHSDNNKIGSEQSSIRRTGVLYFLIGAGIYLFIRLTGIGIVPDEMDWQPTGMAIHYWEIYLSIWIFLTASLVMNLIHAHKNNRITTIILFFSIWIGTAFLWVSIPTMEVLNHSYFHEITAPSYLPYPASDAANFGLWAESILAGFGFKTTIAYRQFLCTVIAFFEALTNRDILKTIDCITIVLALIPACMYLLGRRLHSHGAGILAAGLAALREYNTIYMGPHFMVSNSKMWLSDLPAMLCLLASICAAVDWFQKPRSFWRMLLAGCLMGLCVTIRSQFIVLIPFPVIFFLIRKGLPLKKRFLPAVGFALAALFVIAPWFIRSKIITGDFILDEPGVHSTELARRWSDDVNNVVTRNPGESDAEYAARNKQHMIDFFFEKPLYVIRFTASHFTANEIVALTALPFGTDPNLTIHDVTNTDFHNVETRLLHPRNIPVLMVFLAVIALGMAASWKRAGWAGLLPFILCSLYLGSTGAARYSGWRFALPADWFYYFYFSLGIAEITYQISASFGEKRELFLSVPKLDVSAQPVYPAAIAGILILFLILGAAPALSGKLIPDQYSLQTTDQNIRDLEEIVSSSPDKQKMLAELLAEEGREVLNGRLIYPRYFTENTGLASGHPWIAYRIRDFSRLGFVLLNQENHDIILPMGTEPSYIPNAAYVYVIGSNDEQGFFRADAVIIPSGDSNADLRILTSDKQE
ncbi:MAG: hypothetical protein II969_05635 [Anaerolineaceae bacterium]|nr:hypothetical protein [Anaerolineaceae bacterium]